MSQLELKRARLQSLARILSGQGKLTLMFGNTPCTDLKNITLRLIDGEIVQGVAATKPESWLAMKAAAAHESGHIRFTDKKVWEMAVRHSRIMAHLVNIIEDARIERCMSNLYPGTLVWFRFLNDYIFLNRKDWGTGPAALMGGLISYAVVGRLPVGIAEQKDVAGLVYECAPHIDRGRFAPDTEAVYLCAQEVFNIIRDFLGSYTPPPIPDAAGTPNPEKAPNGELDPRRKPSLPKEPRAGNDEPDAKHAPGESEPGPEVEPQSVDTEVDSPVDEVEDSGSPEENDKAREEKPFDHDTSGDAPDELNGNSKEDSTADKEPDNETEQYGASPKDNQDGNSDLEDEPVSDSKHHEGVDAPPKDEPDNDLEGDSPDADFSDEDHDDASPEDDTDDPEDDLEEDDKSDADGDTGAEDGHEINMDEYTELLEEAETEISGIESSSAREEKINTRTPVQDIDEHEINDKFSKGIHDGCEFRLIKNFSPGDYIRISYESIYSSVKGHINKTVNEIRRILEYRATLIEKNLRKGKLHGNSLWKLHAKDPRVFCKVTEPNDVPELSIYLLVDCSGSMRGTNMDRAVKAACLLYETCAALKIPVNITGFTGTVYSFRDVIHYRVISFDDNYEQKYNIAYLEAQAENRDGYSIRVATRELQLRNEKQKVLIVLSDGMPAMPYKRYHAAVGVNDTALAVREAEKQGIGVIGLYFGPSVYLPQAQKIYNNCIYVSNVAVLPLVIGRVLKKVISTL